MPPRDGESRQEPANRQAFTPAAGPSSSSTTPGSSSTPPTTTNSSAPPTAPPTIVPLVHGTLAYDYFLRSQLPTPTTTTRDIGTSTDLESSPSTLTPLAPPRSTQQLPFSAISSISIAPVSPTETPSTTMGANNSHEVPATIEIIIKAAADAAIADIKRQEQEVIATIKRQEQETIAAIVKASSDQQKQQESTATSPTIAGVDGSMSDVPLRNIKEEEEDDDDNTNSTTSDTTTTPKTDDANEWDPFSPAADESTCFCDNLPSGKMVLCDGPVCRYRFFHATCLGMSQNVLKRHHQRKTDWLCAECKDEVARGQLREDWLREKGAEGVEDGDADMEEV